MSFPFGHRHPGIVGTKGVSDQGVCVLGGKCPGVSVQGVSDRGLCVLGVSVRGVHVRVGGGWEGFCPVTSILILAHQTR